MLLSIEEKFVMTDEENGPLMALLFTFKCIIPGQSVDIYELRPETSLATAILECDCLLDTPNNRY